MLQDSDLLETFSSHHNFSFLPTTVTGRDYCEDGEGGDLAHGGGAGDHKINPIGITLLKHGNCSNK